MVLLKISLIFRQFQSGVAYKLTKVFIIFLKMSQNLTENPSTRFSFYKNLQAGSLRLY